MPLQIQIPGTPLDVFTSGLLKPSQRAWYNGVLRNLMLAYGDIFKEVQAMHNVPLEALCTLVSIENPDASEPKLRARMERIVSGRAVGLCQIDMGTADKALRDEARSGNLSPEEIAFFRAQLGARYDTLVNGSKAGFGARRVGGQTLVHSLKDLINPRYNLHIGALRFGQLMRENTGPDGVIRLDRAIVRYNGSAAPMPPIGSSVAAVLASQKGKNKGRDRNTTYKYILKFIGVNGGMDQLTRGLRTA